MKFLFHFVFLTGVVLFQTAFSYELCIVSLFKDEGPYLREWVKYHQLIGVDHFWLYNDGSTDNWREVLQDYLDDGIVEVFDRPYSSEGKSLISKQLVVFKDGLKKAQDVDADWVALIDLDEFLVPMRELSVVECLNKHFSDVSAVYISWLNFGTSHLWLEEGVPILFQLTDCAERLHPENAIGKSIVRPRCVDIDKIWYVHHFPLKKGNYYMNGQGDQLQWKTPIEVEIIPYHQDKFLRINHYFYRDENFYRNVRLPRRNHGLDLLKEHYKSYGLDKNFRIMHVINSLLFHKPINKVQSADEQWKSFVAD